MSKNTQIRMGDRVDIFLGKGPTYRTIVEDISESGLVMISTPLYRGIPIVMRLNQEIQVFYYRKNGRYAVQAGVVNFLMSGNIRLITLEILSEPKKQQRRESFRFEITLDAVLRHEVDGPFLMRPDPDEEALEDHVTTENISETGCAVRTRKEYYRGEKVFARVFLNWPQPDSEPIELIAEVRMVEIVDIGKNIHRLGLQFLNCSDDMHSHIARFVLLGQQKLLKQGKLYTDDDSED